MGGREIVEVNEIARSPGRALHGAKVLERADRNGGSGNLDRDRIGLELRVGRDALEGLHHIQVPKARRDQRTFPPIEKSRDRGFRPSQGIRELDVATELNDGRRKAVKVLR